MENRNGLREKWMGLSMILLSVALVYSVQRHGCEEGFTKQRGGFGGRNGSGSIQCITITMPVAFILPPPQSYCLRQGSI